MVKRGSEPATFDKAYEQLPDKLKKRITDPKKAKEKIIMLTKIEKMCIQGPDHPKALAKLAEAEFDAGQYSDAAHNYKAAATEALERWSEHYSPREVGKYNTLANKLHGSIVNDPNWTNDLGDIYARKDFGGHILPIIITTGLILGLFFLSPIVTGNAIANLTNQTSNLIGETLFLVGLIGAFFYFRKKK